MNLKGYVIYSIKLKYHYLKWVLIPVEYILSQYGPSLYMATSKTVYTVLDYCIFYITVQYNDVYRFHMLRVQQLQTIDYIRIVNTFVFLPTSF